jgi:hypothetical protein
MTDNRRWCCGGKEKADDVRWVKIFRKASAYKNIVDLGLKKKH